MSWDLICVLSAIGSLTLCFDSLVGGVDDADTRSQESQSKERKREREWEIERDTIMNKVL
jgi:hypothetical protein